MHFTLLSEGKTEREVLKQFIKRWLDPRLVQPVGVDVVKLPGWGGFVKDVAQKTTLHLENPKTIAVIGLLDLYGPTFYRRDYPDTRSRCEWAKSYMKALVKQDRYHQFFAVHEVEAWLFSQPDIFPDKIAVRLRKDARNPESINGARPPAMVLDELYKSENGRSYKKVTDGRALFQKLDPNIAYEKCPNLRAMLDCMLALAQQS